MHDGAPTHDRAAPPAARETGLGVHSTDSGTTVRVHSESAEAIELCLLGEPTTRPDSGGAGPDGVHMDEVRLEMTRGADGIWEVSTTRLDSGQRYGFRAHGRWEPRTGHRFNPRKLLLDPYASVVDGDPDWSPACWAHDLDHPDRPSSLDSAGHVPISRVGAAPGPPATPRRVDPSTLIVYETHVRGLTMRHPAVPETLRGTFAGMAHPAVLEHLVGLGVTAVELMPVHAFVSEPHLLTHGLRNYWGYNPIGFLALHHRYSSTGAMGAASEFRGLVDVLHDAGLAVICDVVYNHTGEGGLDGPTLCFRGLDDRTYHRRPADDPGGSLNPTGTGNALDTSVPAVRELVLASLRHLRRDLGVDGFRFDLATTLIRDRTHTVAEGSTIFDDMARDPLLADAVLIAEPWDLGPDGYRLGRFGGRTMEWNDRFRNDVRSFWRGDTGTLGHLAARLVGSSDVFGPDTDRAARPAAASLNYVTSHDGFTLADLVSYQHKHNEPNAEEGRDGSDHNLSCNHGVEGPSDDPEVTERRTRHRRALLATLLVSHGTPMLLGGDELGRSQDGNNNAYCQDNETSWYRWDRIDTEFLAWVRELVRLRRREPLLRPLRRMTGPAGVAAARWFDRSAQPMETDRWHDGQARAVALLLTSDHHAAAPATGHPALLIIVNGGDDTEWHAPAPPPDTHWRMLMTSAPKAPDDERAATTMWIPQGSITVFGAAGPDARGTTR